MVRAIPQKFFYWESKAFGWKNLEEIKYRTQRKQREAKEIAFEKGQRNYGDTRRSRKTYIVAIREARKERGPVRRGEQRARDAQLGEENGERKRGETRGVQQQRKERQ